MALTIAAVDEIRARLAAVPAKDQSAREVTRVEAVTRMRGEIVALRERGYSWDEVAKMLSTEGCRVTAATLRTELSRKGAPAKTKKREPRRRDKVVESDDRQGSAAVQVERPPIVGANAAPPKPSETRVGGFVVREDSEI